MSDVYAFIDYKRGIYPHPYLKFSSHDFCSQDSNNLQHKRNRFSIVSD